MFEIDVETSAAVRLGAGPITTASRLSVTTPIDAAGKVGFDIPATDPQAALFPDNVSRYVRGRAFGAAWATVGRGVVKGRTLSSDMSLRLSGPDLADELTRTHVGTLQLHDGAGNPTLAVDVLPAILAYALPGWTSTGIPSKDVYYEFGDETVLAALIKVADYTGDHFRITDRVITWLPTTAGGFVPADSGLRAVDVWEGDALPVDTCLIDGDLEEVADDTPRITRIYPRGSGNAGARLYLNGTTRSAPAGYTLHIDADPAQSYIAYNASEAADGIISQVESFRDISVLGDATTTDATSAADALFDAALPFLQKRLTTQKSYRLHLTNVPTQLLPGTSIHVVCTHVVDAYRWISIDRDFVILEATATYEATEAVPAYDLTVSTVDRWPNSDSAPAGVTRGDLRTLATAIQAIKLNAGHLQPAVTAQLAGDVSSASVTPAADAIVRAYGTGRIDAGWLPSGGSPPTTHGSTHVQGASDAIPVATTLVGGLESAADKTNLDTIVAQILALVSGQVVYRAASGAALEGSTGLIYDPVNKFLGVGTAPSAVLHIKRTGANASLFFDGDTSRSKALQFLTAGVQRWIMQSNITAESGSNVGSDFQLLARDDAGAQLFTVLTVQRSTGFSVFTNGTPTLTPAALLDAQYTDTAAGSVSRVATFGRRSSGAGVAGYGGAIVLQLKSSSTNGRDAAQIDASWATATDASRKGRLTFSAYDATAAREGLRVETSGTAAMIGFLGSAAVARPAAYTQTYSTTSRTVAAYTSDPESSAYTGAADGEAKLADLNALRVAYENLRVHHESTVQVLNQLIDDLQAYGLIA